MELKITSRKNAFIQQVRRLLTSRKERQNAGLFVADGTKLLQEAVRFWDGLDTVILTEGVNGTSTCTAVVTYINGVETERTILSEKVTSQPISEIVAVGTGTTEETDRNLPIIGENTITLPTGEVLTYTKIINSLATAYCDKGLTATGTQARVGAIAVDPRYIPYGTRMFIMSVDGEYIYGVATAEDTGSREHIVGTRIDLHYDTRYECIQFGARDCLVFVLG